MLRLRRSRIVLFLAVVTCFLFYNLYSKTQAYDWALQRARLGGQTPVGNTAQGADKPQVQDTPAIQPTKVDAPVDNGIKATSSSVASTTTTTSHHNEETQTKAIVATTAAPKEEEFGGLVVDTHAPPLVAQTTRVAVVDSDADAPLKYTPQAQKPVTTSTTTSQDVQWSKMPEHFPIPTESIIPLPKGKPKQLRKVQHAFKDETSLERGIREKRQAQIVKTFKKSWDGYVKFAWLHDELSPTSGTYRDPFCGWAATLVDSLDSLIIMGLDKEFEDAVSALDKINFKSTPRREIPLFETTIRYLGGLLSAYDLSEQKHQIILDKAVELAEVLMGAFDTPNRMPQTYYPWKPAFVMNPHRAGTRVVMAELGSLSMEFTRLAQLTKQDKYYDAVARITNEMQTYQDKTKIPGLWPLYIDASGCLKPDSTQRNNWNAKLGDDQLKAHNSPPSMTTIVANKNGGVNFVGSDPDPPAPSFNHETNKGRIGNWDEKKVDAAEAGRVPTRQGSGPAAAKRQLDSVPMGVPVHDHAEPDPEAQVPLSPKKPTSAAADCIPQGLAGPPSSGVEEFSFGGMADSTYEYLPKQFALLGGQAPEYQSMYEKSIEAANKYLLYRPMTPTNEKILVLGKGKAAGDPETKGNLNLEASLEHLLCFTGGMYGLGARLFDRPEDLEIAKEMTDACVWAYSITATGIMPEGMELMACEDKDDCKWNQTAWEHEMDPYPQNRIADGLAAAQRILEMQAEEKEANWADSSEAPKKPSNGAPSRGDVRSQYLQNKVPVESQDLEKRQLGAAGNDGTQNYDAGASVGEPLKKHPSNAKAGTVHGDGHPIHDMSSIKSNAAILASQHKYPTATTSGTEAADARALEHAEYVEYRMKQAKLPKGVPSMYSRKYILRPEAIESVFYMYRITGDPEWREKGWKMFEAVQKATDTKYGASAIMDVTEVHEDGTVIKSDEMESFWLAETLKYFYLLFSEENVISLDDWVLNTEAHPFKRPS